MDENWNLQVECCNNYLLEQHLQFAYFSKALKSLSSSGNYKRTQQGAYTALLSYLYKLQVVYTTTMCLPHVYSVVTVQDCASCPNVHMFYMLPDVIIQALLALQTLVDPSRPMTSSHMTSRSHALSCCRLIIILLSYFCPNPNPTKVCPHFRLITQRQQRLYNKLYIFITRNQS